MTATSKSAGSGLIRLSVSMEVLRHEIRLNYEVVNDDSTDIYLLNRLYKTIPKFSLSPDIIYVHLEKEGATVAFLKKIADIPTGYTVNSPVAPFVTPVRAGGRFSENVRVSLPVQEYREYNPEPKARRKRSHQVYRSAYLVVGYFAAVHGTSERDEEFEGSRVIMPMFPQGVRPNFGELVSLPIALEIPVVE